MSRADLEESHIDWDEAPRSRRFGDVYFSARGGLAESRLVFLEGCGLPAAWAGREGFCVAELGLGMGRNLAALLDLWRRTAPAGARLSIFSIEAWPVRAEEAARALAAWPQIGEAAALLAARWPRPARGFHRIDVPEFAAVVDVAVMEASEALACWSGTADAWFLDGFSPARNPAMWAPELMAMVRQRSAPGARLATYSAAAQVRRSLEAQGFAVERKPGFATKRHRLEASLPGPAKRDGRPGRVAIIGAGIAGAALRRAFASEGCEARVFDAAGPGAGASGAPAALVLPRLDAGLGAAAALFAQAARRAGDLYERCEGAVISRGAVQLAVGPKDERRFAAIAASDLFGEGEVAPIGADEMRLAIGEEAAGSGLFLGCAQVVSPAAVLGEWLGEVETATISSLERSGGAWRLLDEAGAPLFEADIVCLAAAMASSRLSPGLPLLPVRGQATVTAGAARPLATLFGGYVIPTLDGLLFGATHARGCEDAAVRAADDEENLVSLARRLPALASRLAGGRLAGWAAVRATSPDYLPLAGAVEDGAAGLFVLSGLGSRGFCLAPLLAEHVAALALKRPSPLPSPAADLVRPGRFAERARKKGRPASGKDRR